MVKKSSIVPALAILVFSTLIAIPIFVGISERRKNNLTERVALLADADRDGTTTEEEWRGVYKKLHIHYDERHPKELTEDQLKTYERMCRAEDLARKLGKSYRRDQRQ